jgi:hypothetical protein
LWNGLYYIPRCTVVEKQVLYDIYNRRTQAASVTAADMHMAERHGGECEDVEAFAVPPTWDDQFICPNGKMQPVISGTVDTLETIACQLGILLADAEAVLSKNGCDSSYSAAKLVEIMNV